MKREDFLNTEASVWPACTADACHQGRDKCPCPASCLVPEEPTPFPFGLGVDGRVAAIAVACLVCAAYFWSAN